MNRQPDIDQLLRSWLDEGDDTPPERYVWAALERVQTTRQRGAFWVSLEERIMRAQPIASVAAIVVAAVIGVAIYFGLTGGPNVGDPDAVETQEFTDPFSLVPPEDWVIVESPDAVLVTPPIGPEPLEERIVVTRTADAVIFGGLEEGFMPWPDDLAAWLEEYPVSTEADGPGSLEVTLVGESETTVDGVAATVLDATSSFTATPGLETSVGFIGPGSVNVGTDVLIFEGEGRVRFVLLPERGVVITYHATDGSFSEASFQAVLDSIRFSDG